MCIVFLAVDGITSESNIVHCSVQNPDILQNIEPQKYVIIKKYRVSMSTSSTDIYVYIYIHNLSTRQFTSADIFITPPPNDSDGDSEHSDCETAGNSFADCLTHNILAAPAEASVDGASLQENVEQVKCQHSHNVSRALNKRSTRKPVSTCVEKPKQKSGSKTRKSSVSSSTCGKTAIEQKNCSSS